MNRSTTTIAKSKPAMTTKPVVRHSVSTKPGVKPVKKPVVVATGASGRYIEAIGRRKTAVVRVRLYVEPPTGVKPGITVNNHSFEAYFPIERHRHLAAAPLTGASLLLVDTYVSAHAIGGGVQAQAEALSLGLARVLIKKEKTWRPRLKALGFLTRDSRKVEKKKFGFRKARRPQQWRKR